MVIYTDHRSLVFLTAWPLAFINFVSIGEAFFIPPGEIFLVRSQLLVSPIEVLVRSYVRTGCQEGTKEGLTEGEPIQNRDLDASSRRMNASLYLASLYSSSVASNHPQISLNWIPSCIMAEEVQCESTLPCVSCSHFKGLLHLRAISLIQYMYETMSTMYTE